MIGTIGDPFPFSGPTVLFVTRVVVSSGGGVGLFALNITTGAAFLDVASLVIGLLVSVDGSGGSSGG